MLTGPRQAGKTTLLRYVEPNRRFVTLDDLENRTLASENPTLFLERYPPPVLIDEFQYAPQLLPYLKIAVDAKRTRMIESAGDYWLTGSQNFTMMEGVQESLAGRVVILKLMGLDLAEILRDETALNRPPFFERPRVNFETDRGVEELFSMILQGDKPELWKQGPNFGNTADYYISYIQTCLERDVRSQLGVKELGLFEKFMRFLAARTAQLLNMTSLASDVGVKTPTIRSWLTILERSFQITLLSPYYRNLTSRQVKTPKVYFLDTGLITHLLKWNDPKTALQGPMAGALFENWVVSQIIKGYWHSGKDPSLFFWRTREGEEIDLVEEAGDKLHVAEIKLTEGHPAGLFKSLEKPVQKRSKKALPLVLGSRKLISTSRKNLPLGDGIDLISAWSL